MNSKPWNGFPIKKAATAVGRAGGAQAALATILLLLLAPVRVQASEGGIGKEVKAQILAERGLVLNERFLKTLNPAISNYGTDEEKAVFKRLINLHLKTRVYFLAFQFGAAYKHVRRTQEVMLKLYGRVVEQSRQRAHQRLVEHAEQVIRDHYNVRARKYLKLGIRDLQVCEQKETFSKNRDPWLYGERLNDLEEALKLTRHANRYVMLLDIEYGSIYRLARPERQSYDELRLVITSGFPKNTKGKLQEHADNYFKVANEAVDLFTLYHESPEFNILEDELAGWDKPDILVKPQDLLPGRPEDIVKYPGR